MGRDGDGICSGCVWVSGWVCGVRGRGWLDCWWGKEGVCVGGDVSRVFGNGSAMDVARVVTCGLFYLGVEFYGPNADTR